ncbi:MAG: hypothetical protein IPM57_10420 [Oligoflexia bacterium]|nr:hypothetical protein [Oligoflexia bacterium]
MNLLDYDIFAFQWPVYSDYELVRHKGAAGNLLSPKIRVSGNKKRLYNPLTVPGLHRSFSALSNNAEDILGFIKTYGLIGIDPKSESVDDIIKCKKELSGVLKVIDINFEFSRKLKKIAKERIEEGKGSLGDTNMPIKIVANLFNTWAQKYLNQIEIKLVPFDRKGQSVITYQVYPKTLLAAFWILSMRELSGYRFKCCEFCGKPFSIGEGGARVDKSTCSVKCRKNLSLRS